MKNFLLFIVFCSFWACKNDNKPKTQNFAFPNVAYTKAVAYHFDDTQARENIVTKAGTLNANIKKEQELNPEQIKHFLGLVNNPDSYGGMSHRCFEPRLGVVFYDAQNKIAAHMSICFQCNNFSSTPVVAKREDMPDGSSAYSELGRQKLVDFCKSLNFGQCGTLD